jgi:hypothetical protein
MVTQSGSLWKKSHENRGDRIGSRKEKEMGAS